MTRAGDAPRNAGDGSSGGTRSSTDAEPAGTGPKNGPKSSPKNGPRPGPKSGGTDTSGDKKATRSSGDGAGGPSPKPSPTPRSSAPGTPPPGQPAAAGPARGRAPLPAPPGVRPPGPVGPPGMGPPPRFAPPPRRELTASQRGRLLAISVALVAVGSLLGFIVALMLPTKYAAQTTIQYNIAGENTGDFLKTDRNLTTQVVLITSRNVLQPVADASGIAVDDLTKKVTATILGSSTVIMIEVRDSNREAAVNLANAIAQQYLTVANSSGPEGYLQNQLNEVKRQLAAPAPGTTAAQTAALNARAATLQAQLDNMNLTTNQSKILAPAYSVTDPVSPNKGLAWLTGGICGLIIALMLSVNLSRRWTRST